MTIWQLLQLARSNLDRSKFAYHFQSDNLHITTTSLGLSQTDGEEIGNRPIGLILDISQYPTW